MPRLYFIIRILVTLLFAACGAVIGLAISVVALTGMALLHGRLSSDPSAGGGWGWLIFELGPMGIGLGILLGVLAANRLYTGRRKLGVKILKSGD